MSLLYATGSFQTVSAGNVSVTGLSFQPKVYILFCTNGVVGYQTGIAFSMGASDGTNNGAVAITGINQNPSDVNGSNNTDVAEMMNTSVGGFSPITHVSMDSGGFTVHTTSASDNVAYIAIGGTDLTNVIVKSVAASTATGSVATTGAGFQPDAALFIWENVPASTYVGVSVGAAVSSSKRWCVAMSANAGASMGNGFHAKRYQRTDSVLLAMNNTTEVTRADFTSFGSDGYTLNYVTATAGVNQNYIAVLFKTGGQVDVGALTKSTGAAPVTDTITPSISGTAPAGALFATFGLAATTSISADGRISLGAGDGTNEGASWSMSTDATVSTLGACLTLFTKALNISTAPSTTNAEADHALTSTTATLTWTTNDATAEQVLWMIFGSQAAAASTFQDAWGQPPNNPAPYKNEIVAY